MQTLLESARYNYFSVFRSIREILNWKNSALVWSDLLRQFLNTLTADNKYYRCNIQNFAQQVKTPLSQKEKTFSGFLLHSWNVHEMWNILKQKMSIIA